jgi:hypothetical protein
LASKTGQQKREPDSPTALKSVTQSISGYFLLCFWSDKFSADGMLGLSFASFWWLDQVGRQGGCWLCQIDPPCCLDYPWINQQWINAGK